MLITRISINNPVFATMVMVGITVLGVFSYNRLRVEQMPDVTLPYVLVMTNYPGASPEVVQVRLGASRASWILCAVASPRISLTATSGFVCIACRRASKYPRLTQRSTTSR